MLDWKKLQDMNLRDVAAKTQLELSFLKALVDDDFEALQRFNVRGFIKILSREYELDFTSFYEAYDKYLEENNIQDSNQPATSKTTKDTMVTPKLDSYTQETKSSIWPKIILVIIIVIAAAGAYYYDTIKTFLQSENNFTSKVFTDIIQEAQENLQKTKEQIESETELNEENISIDIEKSLDLNATLKEIEAEDLNSSSQNTQELEISQQENNTSSQNTENPSGVTAKVAIFKPEVKMWIGTINLANHRKVGSVKEGEFEIPLDKEQLILTGAAALNIVDENGKTHSFPAGNSKRFHIKDGKITTISLADFLKLNRGREW